MTDRPIEVRFCTLFPNKRPWNKVQAIFHGAMFRTAGLGRDTFDIRCLTNGVRIFVRGSSVGNNVALLQLATITVGVDDMRLMSTQNSSRQKKTSLHKPRSSLDHGSFSRFMSIVKMVHGVMILARNLQHRHSFLRDFHCFCKAAN